MDCIDWYMGSEERKKYETRYELDCSYLIDEK
jgi:hypothetical protein